MTPEPVPLTSAPLVGFPAHATLWVNNPCSCYTVSYSLFQRLMKLLWMNVDLKKCFIHFSSNPGPEDLSQVRKGVEGAMSGEDQT